MPGGKIAFYTGILEVTKDENGLAAVMGHEIAMPLQDTLLSELVQHLL